MLQTQGRTSYKQGMLQTQVRTSYKQGMLQTQVRTSHNRYRQGHVTNTAKDSVENEIWTSFKYR